MSCPRSQKGNLDLTHILSFFSTASFRGMDALSSFHCFSMTACQFFLRRLSIHCACFPSKNHSLTNSLVKYLLSPTACRNESKPYWATVQATHSPGYFQTSKGNPAHLEAAYLQGGGSQSSSPRELACGTWVYASNFFWDLQNLHRVYYPTQGLKRQVKEEITAGSTGLRVLPNSQPQSAPAARFKHFQTP